MIDLITDNSKWQKTLEEIGHYDIYHTAQYHNLPTPGKPYLFVFRKQKLIICFPYLLRKIPKTTYTDITSTYGYSGILSNQKNIPIKDQLLFIKELKQHFKERNSISVFCRLHPFFEKECSLLRHYGKIQSLNKTVYLDLNLTTQQQTTNYCSSLRRQLKKQACELSTYTTFKKEDISTFQKIYTEAMIRLGASKNYFFNKDYFEQLFQQKDFQSILFLTEQKGQIIGGAIFTLCNSIMQYHLGAVKNEAISSSPIKQIIDKARIYGNTHSAKILHLGGGHKGLNDNLFYFKSRFSPLYKEYKVWKAIVNPPIYHELSTSHTSSNNSFFPQYRG